MKYLGGKSRIVKHLVPIIQSYLTEDTIYVEPFVGGGNVIQHVKSSYRLGCDIDHELIEYFRALQGGWLPPTTVTQEDYYEVKRNSLEPELRAFVGVACSFGAKKWGGYARSKKCRSYAQEGYNSAVRQLPLIKDVVFDCKDYTQLLGMKNCVFYCDPPYNGMTGYSNVFDSEKFYYHAEQLSKHNTVLVSEYSAPSHWQVLWQKEVSTELSGKHRRPRVEKLYLVTDRH